MFRKTFGYSMMAACSAMLAATPALAQDASEKPDIVVEGIVEIDGSDAQRQARDITHPQSSSSEPLARLQRPICVGSWGLLAENAEAVISRMYDNAEAIGLDIDTSDGCEANVWVLVVDDPPAEFEKLRDDSNWMTRTLTKFERNRVRKQEGPVRAWHLVTTRDDAGNPIPTGFQLAQLIQQSRLEGTPPPVNPTTNMSRTRVPIRKDIEMSFVMIARSALEGLDTHAIADYATMRTFARTEVPDREEYFETVLNLFDDNARIDRMTTFDRAYLRSLYRGSPNRPSRQAMASLSNLMEEELNAGVRE